MTFQTIRKADWPRAEYFDHYFSAVPCTYSMTAKLDIRAWRKSGRKLYPAMLHAITTVVNRHEEFRTAFVKEKISCCCLKKQARARAAPLKQPGMIWAWA